MDKKRGLKGGLKRSLSNRKGQFFLIAALVIIAIILGLASVQIASKVSKENIVIFNLANEIDLEGKSVVDHGIFEGATPKYINDKITQLMDYYTSANPNQDIVIVYTNPDNPNTYNVVNNTIIPAGSQCYDEVCNPAATTKTISTSGSCGTTLPCTVQLTNNGEPVSEAVINAQGQTFYAVIVGTTASGETTIATNSPQKPAV